MLRSPIVALLVAVLTIAACVAHAAAGPLPPDVSFRWAVLGPGVPARIATADGRVFVLMRARDDLVVVDVLQRTAPLGPPGGHASLRVAGRLLDLAYARSRTLDATTNLHLNREVLYLVGSRNDGELMVADVTRGEPLALEAVHDLPGRANALSVATDGAHVFVGRARSREPELVALDPDGTVLGILDLGESIVHLSLEDTILLAESKRLAFRVDVRDPMQPVLLETTPRRPADAPPLAIARTVDFAVGGPFAYHGVRARDAEVQQVNLRLPLHIEDIDGDGLHTLACTGDSNTVPHAGLERWCEVLADLVDDPSFVVWNLAVSGATAIPSGNSAYDQVEAALAPTLHADAVVLAFGTNDTNLVFFDPDPALFDAQLDAIADHLEVHYAAIEAAGRRAFVATAPPRWRALFAVDGYNERIVGLNERIRQRFPAERIIEHYDWFYASPDEFIDGVHATQTAQNRRALRALETLTR